MSKKKLILAGGLLVALSLAAGLLGKKQIAKFQAERQQIHQRIAKIEARIQAWEKESPIHKAQLTAQKVKIVKRKTQSQKKPVSLPEDEEYELIKNIENSIDRWMEDLADFDQHLDLFIEDVQKTGDLLSELNNSLHIVLSSDQEQIEILENRIHSRRLVFEQRKGSIDAMKFSVFSSIHLLERWSAEIKNEPFKKYIDTILNEHRVMQEDLNSLSDSITEIDQMLEQIQSKALDELGRKSE